MTPINTSGRLRTIALEEHYATPAIMAGPGRQLRELAESATAHPQVRAAYARLVDQLCDLGDQRIAEMDATGIDTQVVSLTFPGLEQLDGDEAVALARSTNDYLADAIQRHPQRLIGFAALPTAAPDAAAEELERVVQGHGFRGALINGHVRGRYLDDTFFWPILERAAALRVPIYLHPAPPPQAVIAASYTGNFAPEVTNFLATAAWGWHIETATHILRIILSGVFDRYPDLQFVIGHMGEALPFMLPRLDMSLPAAVTTLERPFAAYLRENIYYTFGAFNWTPAFLDLMLQVGVERIMFSTDYPYGSMAQARTFLDQLPVSPADKARIAYGNAERLLRL